MKAKITYNVISMYSRIAFCPGHAVIARDGVRSVIADAQSIADPALGEICHLPVRFDLGVVRFDSAVFIYDLEHGSPRVME